MQKLISYSHRKHRHLAAQISHLYHDAVQAVSDEHYNVLQRQAWSAAPRSIKHWQLELKRTQTWLIVVDNQFDKAETCVGFIQLETGFIERGYIPTLYVKPSYQRKGIAKRLIQKAIDWSKEQEYRSLTTDASHLSKSVFEACGFRKRYNHYQEKRQIVLTSYAMSLLL